MKIRAGDVVTVIAGKDKGKQGSVVRVLAEKSRVVVEGVNMRIRHIKKTPQQAGQRISYEASIHASNVMILDPKTKKPTRIGYKVDPKTGEKKRIAKKSGEVIMKSVARATEEKTPKTQKAQKVQKKDDAPAAASEAAPKKQPFWKRKGSEKGSDSGSDDRGEGGGTSFTTAHRSQGG